jgi:type I restriction enzyme S subunit
MSDGPWELPDNWTWTTLSEVIIDARPGFASGKKDVIGGIPHLRMNNIGPDCRLNLDIVRTVPKELALEKYLLKPGDVLFCHTNSRKLVGKTALFNPDRDGIFAFSNHLTRIRVDPDVTIPEWVWQDLATLWRDRYYETRCKQWVNQATVEREELLNTPIPLAPLVEQHRINTKIKMLQEQGNNVRQALDRLPVPLKRFRKAVLYRAFRGELTVREPANEPAKLLIERIQEEKRRRREKQLRLTGESPRRHNYEDRRPMDREDPAKLPDGWAWARVDDVADVRLGLQRSPRNRPGKYARRYLRVANVFRGYFNLSDVKEMDFRPNQFEEYRLQPGDILLCEGQSPGLVGRCAVWDGEIPDCCFQNTLIRVRPILVSSKYLMYKFFDSAEKGDFIDLATQGVNIAHLGATRLAGYKIPIAPLHEQEYIVSRIESLFSHASMIEDDAKMAGKRLEQLDQAILAKAFRGLLTEQDPNDEPAAVLLERSRKERLERGGSARGVTRTNAEPRQAGLATTS